MNTYKIHVTISYMQYIIHNKYYNMLSNLAALTQEIHVLLFGCRKFSHDIVLLFKSQRSYDISNIAEFAVSVRSLNTLSSVSAVLGSG